MVSVGRYSRTSSSTRSSDDSPSSSSEVSDVTVRPAAHLPTNPSTPSPAARETGRDGISPRILDLISRRFSLRVPSVRGNASPGHTVVPRIRW